MADYCINDFTGYCLSPENKQLTEQEGRHHSLGGQVEIIPYHSLTCPHNPKLCPHYQTFTEHYKQLLVALDTQ